MKIVLATENPGKVTEIKRFLQDLQIDLISQSDCNVPPIPETGLSFVENALLKARHAAKHTDLPAIADDSGLAVEVLGGAPGIYSARYAGEDASAEDNIQKLLDTLKSIPETDRQAHFHCALVLVRHHKDPTPIICQAQWQGVVLKEPIGEGGFGYDPIFYIPELKRTAAELSRLEKNKISHRAQALKELVEQLKKLYPLFQT